MNSARSEGCAPEDLLEFDGLSYDQLQRLIRDEEKRRKNHESDVNLLKNRVQHLRHELDITKKKILDTRSRVKQIQVQRKVRQERALNLKARKETMYGSISNDAQKNNKLREESRRKRKEILDSQLKQRKDMTKQLQEEKERILLAKKEMEERVRKEKEEKRKKRLDEVKRKKEREMAKEKKLLEEKRLAKERQVAENAKICIKKAEEVKRLEELELKLIQDLRNAQARQSGAYKELEATLN